MNPEITPAQREAALRLLGRAIYGISPDEPDRHGYWGDHAEAMFEWEIERKAAEETLDALIAQGWGQVADAEARGYRAGVEAAESVAQAEKDRRAGLARNPVAAAHHASGFVAALAIVEGIRSLTPEKPKEAEGGKC